MQTIYKLDPLHDSRWPRFLKRHARASIFHTSGWLEALHRTYGYEPVVYTTSAPDQELTSGVAFCRITSWLTGRRLVSVPFSDHCQPLGDPEDLKDLILSLKDHLDQEKWKYVELRPLTRCGYDLEGQALLPSSEQYYFHSLDLRPDLNVLFHDFHRNSVRSIRRAEREQLSYEEGRSESILSKFYSLLLLTRRRHGLPPQPIAWFRNLIDSLGENLVIRIASKDGRPVASILTLIYKDTLVYKYGCSDARFHKLGGTTLLFWKAIQESKQHGAQQFDLGRSEVENAGLAEFKERLGAQRSQLSYFRLVSHRKNGLSRGLELQIFRHAFSLLPNSLLTAAAKTLYRHVG
jgi:hypothetical protein